MTFDSGTQEVLDSHKCWRLPTLEEAKFYQQMYNNCALKVGFWINEPINSKKHRYIMRKTGVFKTNKQFKQKVVVVVEEHWFLKLVKKLFKC